MATRMSAAVKPAVLSTSQRHLLDRFTFGVNEAQLTLVRADGGAGPWFSKQWTPSKISDPYGDQVKSWFPRLADSPANAWARVKSGERSGWAYGHDMARYTLGRKMRSRHQVLEVMTDFWSNLLFIPVGEDRSFPWRYDYDRKIRANALTSYRALLRATVTHPAMSGWLNNNSNTKRGINENLGRELLELYTVGRPADYDENDVKNSARLLTGFRVKVFDTYEASYDPSLHWTGPIKVLGFTHANSNADGRAAVNAYLDYLARHPSTAQRVAFRLCQRFISDAPSKTVVSAVAAAYLKHDTSIRPTIAALVAHPEFKSARKRKFRTPTEDVIASARALGLRPTGARGAKPLITHLYYMGSQIGQEQFGWPRPDGFPETGSTWGSPARILRSWDVHYALAGNWWGSTDHVRPSAASSMPTKWPLSIDQLVEHQARVLLGRPSTSAMRLGAASTLNHVGSFKFARASDVSSWAWTVIRATVLNHPEGVLR